MTEATRGDIVSASKKRDHAGQVRPHLRPPAGRFEAGSREAGDPAKRSRAHIVKETVAAYVEDERDYQAVIDEALKEADEGEFVSGEAAIAWLRRRRETSASS